MFYCFVNLSVYILFYIKCFEITIASTTANLHVILDRSLNFLDFLPTLCLSYLPDDFLGSKFS